MGFNWLKTLGQAVKVGAGIIPAYGPLIASLIPGTRDDRFIVKAVDSMEQVQEIIKQAEIFGAALSLSGADRLKGAIPSIGQVMMRSAIMGGLPPGDQVEFDASVIDLTNALIRMSKSRAEQS